MGRVHQKVLLDVHPEYQGDVNAQGVEAERVIGQAPWRVVDIS